MRRALSLSNNLTRISKLSNGIRVTSENVPGYFGALGVYVDAGPRVQPSHLVGLSQFNEKLAFKVTWLLYAKIT